MHSAVLDSSIISLVATWVQRSVFSSAKLRVLEGLKTLLTPVLERIFPNQCCYSSQAERLRGCFLPLHFGLWDLQCFSEATRTDSQWMISRCLSFKDRRSSYSHTVGPPNTSLERFHYLVQILHRATMLCCSPCLTGDTAPEVQNKAHQHNYPTFGRKLTMTAV